MKLTLFCCFLSFVAADVLLHNPRGSNNRNEESTSATMNNARLFNSQNNAQGGYCKAPSMSYYEGSVLSIEWTHDHGCGQDGKVYCNIILQYMCSESNAPLERRVRDGADTDRITADEIGPVALTQDEMPRYGMHENLAYLRACQTRDRQQGLWTGDALPGEVSGSARFTRQDPTGNRRGFECNEEREYYPYWAPTPWKDIAILTDDISFCPFYQAESENVKPRAFCADAETGEQSAENNQEECNNRGQEWTISPSFGIDPPDCLPAPFGRPNHLGDSRDTLGMASSYNWTLPRASQESCIVGDNCNCVLRIRYNISSNDLGPNGNRPDTGFIDWTQNDEASPIVENPIMSQSGLPFKIAVSTRQVGRTFQDRSHVFHIRPRPSGVASDARIFNLNVRGKRGNIVQTFPAVEYDFVPNRLVATPGDYIHFQWTGCDSNPTSNVGEGTRGTDRSNIVQIESLRHNFPASDSWLSANPVLFPDLQDRRRMALAGQTNCAPLAELEQLTDEDPENCLKLNKGPQHFDGGLIQFNDVATFHYMCTRNNKFSNRGQKGTIIISEETQDSTTPSQENGDSQENVDEESSAPALALGVMLTLSSVFAGLL